MLGAGSGQVPGTGWQRRRRWRAACPGAAHGVLRTREVLGGRAVLRAFARRAGFFPSTACRIAAAQRTRRRGPSTAHPLRRVCVDPCNARNVPQLELGYALLHSGALVQYGTPSR